METIIIKIGNSKGVIIPANIIKLLGLEDSVRLELDNKRLILTEGKKKNQGKDGTKQSGLKLKNMVNLSGYYLIFLKTKISGNGPGESI